MSHLSNFAPVVDVAADIAQFLDSLQSIMPMLCFAEHRHNKIDVKYQKRKEKKLIVGSCSYFASFLLDATSPENCICQKEKSSVK